MIFPYAIEPTQRFVRTALTGTVRGRDIADTVEAIYCDPRWQAGYDTIWDAIATTAILLELDDHSTFLKVQRQYSALAGRGLDVLIVNTSLDYGMLSAYSVLARGGPRQVYIVRTEAEAIGIRRRWHAIANRSS
jgi:hypothetical protein